MYPGKYPVSTPVSKSARELKGLATMSNPPTRECQLERSASVGEGQRWLGAQS